MTPKLRRAGAVVVALVVPVLLLAACGGVVGSLVSTENGIKNADYGSVSVNLVDSSTNLSISASTSGGPPTETDMREIAGIVWHQFHFLFDTLSITLSGGGQSGTQTFTFDDLQTLFGPRDASYNKTTVQSGVEHFGLEIVLVIVAVVVVVVALVIVLLWRRRRRRRQWAAEQQQHWFQHGYGYGPPPGYGPGGYPSQPGGYGPPPQPGYGPQPGGYGPPGAAPQPRPYGEPHPGAQPGPPPGGYYTPPPASPGAPTPPPAHVPPPDPQHQPPASEPPAASGWSDPDWEGGRGQA